MGKKWSKFQMLPMKMKLTGWIALSMRIPEIELFWPGSPNFEGETAEKFREMAKNRETYSYADKGVVSSNREYWPLLPGI